jgi:hypothetical protein
MKHLLRFCILIILTAGANRVYAQYDSVYLVPGMFTGKIEELRKAHGYGKEFPPKYELAILVALSYYPELDSVSIDFEELPINSTMMAQPHTRTLFSGKSRTYAVFINNSPSTTGFSAEELTFNQFVGVMGHELAHISYYTGCNSWDLIRDGIGYYFWDFRRDFEAGTDRITIDHGLGWQLVDFTHYLNHEAFLSDNYANKKKSYYLSDDQMVLEIRNKGNVHVQKSGTTH